MIQHKPRILADIALFIQIAVFVWICVASFDLLTTARRLNRLSAELVQARVVWAECRDKVDELSQQPRDGGEAMRRLGMLEVTPNPDDVKPLPDGGPQ